MYHTRKSDRVENNSNIRKDLKFTFALYERR